jgi:hypothetical protein
VARVHNRPSRVRRREFAESGSPSGRDGTGDEIVEAQRHESLINLAFEGASGWIMCPYDTRSLAEDVLAEAYRSHPYIAVGSSRQASSSYLGLHEIGNSLSRPLPEPQGRADAMEIVPGCLAAARHFVQFQASAHGLAVEKVEDLKLTVTELVANTLAHGGGYGTLRLWVEATSCWRSSTQGPSISRSSDAGRPRRRRRAGEACGW